MKRKAKTRGHGTPGKRMKLRSRSGDGKESTERIWNAGYGSRTYNPGPSVPLTFGWLGHQRHSPSVAQSKNHTSQGSCTETNESRTDCDHQPACTRYDLLSTPGFFRRAGRNLAYTPRHFGRRRWGRLVENSGGRERRDRGAGNQHPRGADVVIPLPIAPPMRISRIISRASRVDGRWHGVNTTCIERPEQLSSKPGLGDHCRLFPL